jgi:hypothetical protein
MKLQTLFAATVFAVAPMVSQAQGSMDKPAPTKDIVETAIAAGSFKTLALALPLNAH